MTNQERGETEMKLRYKSIIKFHLDNIRFFDVEHNSRLPKWRKKRMMTDIDLALKALDEAFADEQAEVDVLMKEFHHEEA